MAGAISRLLQAFATCLRATDRFLKCKEQILCNDLKWVYIIEQRLCLLFSICTFELSFLPRVLSVLMHDKIE